MAAVSASSATACVPGALADTAPLRALVTSSKVDCSCLAYPLTDSTRFGIRSCRRWSAVSIWAQLLSTALRRPIVRL